MVIGMAISEVIKKNNYKMKDDMEHGIFGISSAGYPVVHGQEDSDSASIFQFGNDTVHIESDSKTRKITFSKKGTSEKHAIDVKESTIDFSKLQFVVGLLSGDTAEITE